MFGPIVMQILCSHLSNPIYMCKLKFIPKIIHNHRIHDHYFISPYKEEFRITALSITSKKTQINPIKSTITILRLLFEHFHQTESVRSG